MCPTPFLPPTLERDHLRWFFFQRPSLDPPFLATLQFAFPARVKGVDLELFTHPLPNAVSGEYPPPSSFSVFSFFLIQPRYVWFELRRSFSAPFLRWVGPHKRLVVSSMLTGGSIVHTPFARSLFSVKNVGLPFTPCVVDRVPEADLLFSFRFFW